MSKIIFAILISFSLGIILGINLYPIITNTYIVDFTINSTNKQGTATYTISKTKAVNESILEKKIEKKLNKDVTINSINN